MYFILCRLDNIYEKPVIKLCPKDRISSIPFDIKNGSTNNHMLFYFIRTTQPCIFSVIYIAPGILSRWQNIQNLFLLSSQLSIIILLEAEYSCCLWWLYEKRTPLLFHNVSFFHNICLLDKYYISIWRFRLNNKIYKKRCDYFNGIYAILCLNLLFDFS